MFVLRNMSFTQETDDRRPQLTKVNNPDGEVSLWQACKENDVEKVVELVKSNAPLEVVEGKTCMEIAIENGNRNIAKEILEHKNWRESLRNPTKSRGILQTTPFRKLIKAMPDIAILVLDKCVISKNSEVNFDYEFVEEFEVTCLEGTDDTQVERAEISDGIRVTARLENDFFKKESHVLEDMKQDLLLHPVVSSLLRWKWTRYVAWFYFLNLVVYLVFVTFLTTFALAVPNPQLQKCKNHDNQTINSTVSCGLSIQRRSLILISAIITIGFSVIRLIMEFFQICKLPELFKCLRCKHKGIYSVKSCDSTCKYFIHNCIEWQYFKQGSNCLEIPMYILSILFGNIFHIECLCPSSTHWQAGIVAVFFAWMNLLLFLNKLPAFGIYIAMLWKIMMKFIKVSIVALLLHVAFAFAFYMTFYEPQLPDAPFKNPIIAFLEVFSFTIADPDISVLGLGNDGTEMNSIPFPVVSYAIWIIFCIVMSVLFLNFLVGLAVDDVQELRKQGQKHRVKLMINLVTSVDDTINFMVKLLKFVGCYKCAHNIKKRLSTKHYSIKYRSVWTKMAILWGDNIDNIVKDLNKSKKEMLANEVMAVNPF